MTTTAPPAASPAAPEPEPEIVIGSREQLLHLLAEAAEIEHTLMCSYLYAAFSLKRAADFPDGAAAGDAVERWRKMIMGVAIEEMGHLLIVANLMVAVGGRPHLGRPNFPVSPGYFPSGVVVRLGGFSPATLDHFIFLERPQGLEGADAPDYVAPEYVREQARPGLMPSAQDYATIGHLYDAIRVNLRAMARKGGEKGLFVGGAEGQLGHDDVNMPGVGRIASLAEAVAAIDTIVEQGEGSPADRDTSHYRSFRAIRDEFRALQAADPGFAPAWPVADNPVLRRPLDPADRRYIDAPAAALLLDFACATYGLLLRVLVACFGRTGHHVAADRAALMALSFALMHELGAAASALARLPASPEAPGVHAGMTFTMLRGIEPLIQGAVEQTIIAERLAALARAAARLPALGDGAAGRIDALAAGFRLGG